MYYTCRVSSNRALQPPKNRTKIRFSSKKKGLKEDSFQEINLFSPTFTYLTGHQAVKKVTKMDSGMIWTKNMLMLSEARNVLTWINGDKKTIKYQN